jgi:hypothetical protein
LSVPRLRSCIVSRTFAEAFLLYFRAMVWPLAPGSVTDNHLASRSAGRIHRGRLNEPVCRSDRLPS